VLQEKVLEVRTQTLPDHHPDLQAARANLAATLQLIGDYEGARVLEEKVLEVLTRTLPDHHPHLQMARGNLGTTIQVLGDLEGARALKEKALKSQTQYLPDHHPLLQVARNGLADTIQALGDLEGALVLQEKVLEILTQTLPDHHPDLQVARTEVAWTRAQLGEETSGLTGDLARGTRKRIETFGSLLSPRELRVLADQERFRVSTALSLALFSENARGDDSSARLFSLVESVRGVESSSMRFQRKLAPVQDDELQRLRDEAARANQALVQHSELESEELGRFQELLRAKEAAESQVARYARSLLHGERVMLAGSPAEIAAALDGTTAAIGYWRYIRPDLEGNPRDELRFFPHYMAHVLLIDGTLSRVELGPSEVVDKAVKEWRVALRNRGARGITIAGGADRTDDPEKELNQTGDRLRQLIFDPLVPQLGDSKKLIVALDGTLHLVPLVALPTDAGVLGDRYGISLRTTLRELLAAPSTIELPPSLLALGGVQYGRAPEAPATGKKPNGNQPVGATPLRGSSWREFGALQATGEEVELVTQSFGKKFADAESRPDIFVLKGEEASREALALLAPRASYLHLATHGYFLDESVPSMADERIIDEALGITASRDMAQQVRGYLPMQLCGLALAGANAPENEWGRVPGILTAQELAGWNLDHCKLAVISACDSNVGVLRAGQGVASFQEALYAAGVRASITSLWKVPDRATKELFNEFYRRLWLLGEGKAEALWNAQQKLRRAADQDGNPTYRTRDWAAWVLVGDSN
jgi:CHAT domain-containing protein